MSDLTQTLALTPEQAPRVKEIQMSAMQAMMPFHQIMVTKEQAITTALQASAPDAAAIKQLVDEEASAMASCQKILVDVELAMKDVLTPEQYAKLPPCPMLNSSMMDQMDGMMPSTDGQSGDHTAHHGG